MSGPGRVPSEGAIVSVQYHDNMFRDDDTSGSVLTAARFVLPTGTLPGRKAAKDLRRPAP